MSYFKNKTDKEKKEGIKELMQTLKQVREDYDKEQAFYEIFRDVFRRK